MLEITSFAAATELLAIVALGAACVASFAMQDRGVCPKTRHRRYARAGRIRQKAMNLLGVQVISRGGASTARARGVAGGGFVCGLERGHTGSMKGVGAQAICSAAFMVLAPPAMLTVATVAVRWSLLAG